MKSPVPDLIHGLRCLSAILAKAETLDANEAKLLASASSVMLSLPE